jgi:hypothetical protein
MPSRVVDNTTRTPQVDVSAAAHIHTPHIEFNEAYVAGHASVTPSRMPQRWNADASTRQFEDRNVERIAAAMGI